MANVTIRDVKTILTAPEGINLVVVKIETSEPGLYGLGCATFTQRYLAVATAIEEYLKPFLIGKDPQRIEDIWQTAMVSSYWRNGPVLNNALSGVDMALWDIKGKLAGLPVYQLLGGKCREGAAIYRHADGRDEREVEENVRKYMEQGIHYIRCQMGGYGGRDHKLHQPEQPLPGAYFDPKAYMRSVPRLFAHIRGAVGEEVELLHDIHERLVPIEAVRLARELEPYRLFFLEDPLAPEQLDWFETLRAQTATPIAMGELFTHPREWTPLIANRLIDFIRCHISAIGGLTPAKKLASLCEAFSVRTAWHGPGDVSPVGHAANLHLDVSSINFGVQEWYGLTDRIREVFPGCPELRNGYAYVNEAPGLGIDIDEKKAAEYPCDNRLPAWTLARTPDGTSVRP
ncbi:starvation-sensing protein RspA [Paenibacillus sp. MWE-103]|uniref:Starvation-sensing protein RspA n=1 Tax=Paenibacillus artemisiicola TaxID=1172618 RepID=A0ABS3WAL8_9BACL|nr:enolase C-terminal domain-like protein [Paenibacillus artemisiicola]MBO7745366.1 starvation-sensing protein RspA [Paenibacillus artemisiicola]